MFFTLKQVAEKKKKKKRKQEIENGNVFFSSYAYTRRTFLISCFAFVLFLFSHILFPHPCQLFHMSLRFVW